MMKIEKLVIKAYNLRKKTRKVGFFHGEGSVYLYMIFRLFCPRHFLLIIVPVPKKGIANAMPKRIEAYAPVP